MLLILTVSINQHIHDAQNKYELLTITKILNKVIIFIFVNTTTNKTKF